MCERCRLIANIRDCDGGYGITSDNAIFHALTIGKYKENFILIGYDTDYDGGENVLDILDEVSYCPFCGRNLNESVIETDWDFKNLETLSFNTPDDLFGYYYEVRIKDVENCTTMLFSGSVKVNDLIKAAELDGFHPDIWRINGMDLNPEFNTLYDYIFDMNIHRFDPIFLYGIMEIGTTA